MRMDKGKPFRHIEADELSAPTFSEAFLYERVGKGDARFILGVADEYEHVIAALGPEAVRAVLDVRPRLAQRLGLGAQVVEWLRDALSDRALELLRALPAQVTLDSEAAEAAWRTLHREYRRYYDPEKSMDPDALRAYHALTDGLGEHEQSERQKERDRLPQKLAAQAAKRAALEAERTG